MAVRQVRTWRAKADSYFPVVSGGAVSTSQDRKWQKYNLLANEYPGGRQAKATALSRQVNLPEVQFRVPRAHFVLGWRVALDVSASPPVSAFSLSDSLPSPHMPHYRTL